mmetsp:Transcript_10602/g.15821  ORF Transcript_10602/g.15821 Transcript_10602/m.15821 type:complete len:125 (-) Transcript_10602:1244-1618(-)
MERFVAQHAAGFGFFFSTLTFLMLTIFFLLLARLIDSTQFAVVMTFLRDFDPVATTELGMIAKLQQEFEDRNVSIIAVSKDNKSTHRAWIECIEELQDCKISFPLICDVDGSVSLWQNTKKGIF